MSRALVVRNFSIQVGSRILAVLVGLVSIGIMTRALGTSGFGEYTTAVTFLQVFAVIVDFGLTLTLVVMVSEENANTERIIGNIFAMRMIAGVFVFTLAPITVLALPWSDTIKEAVFIGTVGYVFMGGATLLVGVFQRYQSMWRAGLAEIINRLALLTLIAGFAWFHFGVVAMVAASVVANAVWLFFMIRLAQPFVHIRFLMEWKIWREVWSRSWPIAVSIFFNLLYLKGDILFLAYYRSQTDVGLYGVSYRFIDMLTALPVMFMGILLPLAVNHWSRGSKKEFEIQVKRTFDLFMTAAIPIVVGTQVIAKPLMRLIAGPGYEQSADVLRLLILAVFGVFIGALFGHLVVAINRQRQMTWGYVGVAILTVIGYYIFIPTYGIWGAVWMTLFSEGLIALITFGVVYQVTHVRPSFKISLKALLASIIMFLSLQLFAPLGVVPNLLIGGIVYFASMVLIKGIDVKDLRSLMSPKAIKE